jgi:hypothetical protein
MKNDILPPKHITIDTIIKFFLLLFIYLFILNKKHKSILQPIYMIL